LDIQIELPGARKPHSQKITDRGYYVDSGERAAAAQAIRAKSQAEAHDDQLDERRRRVPCRRL